MEYYYYDYEDEDDPTVNTYDDEYDDTVMFKINESSFEDTLKNCVNPSIIQIIGYVGTLIGWNLLCRLTWAAVKFVRLSQWINHVISFACGCGVLHYIIGMNFLIVLLFAVTSFVLLLVLEYNKSRRMGFIVATITISGFLAYELLWDNPSVWHTIRGILMVATMKTISLSFDLDSKRERCYQHLHSPAKRETITFVPALFPFLGYIFCPGNCVLGPWISYDSYIQSLNCTKIDFKWVVWILSNVVLAIAFLSMSNCFVAMLCMDYSWKWFVTYRDALSIRCSHYFVSFLSQATMAAAGMGASKETQPGIETSNVFGNLVTKPWEIEFPRSLTTVVRSWNIPMHYWLKTYVFRPLKIQGRRSVYAIACTYIVSSLLHGLHFQIYAVLFSLGFFTYVEFKLRSKIATIFNACICANSCNVGKKPSPDGCQKHQNHWNSLGVILFNSCFSVLTIMHLAYLGIMLDMTTANSSASREHRFSIDIGLRKWMQLDFLSHLIYVLSYLFYLII